MAQLLQKETALVVAKINLQKTKLMTDSSKSPIKIDSEIIKWNMCFICLYIIRHTSFISPKKITWKK